MEATRGCLLLWPVRLTVSRLLVLGQVWGVRQLPCELALRGDGAFCWAAPARAPRGNHGCAALRPAGCGTPGRLAAFPLRRPSCVAATRVFLLSWPLASSFVLSRLSRAFTASPDPARRAGGVSRLAPRAARFGFVAWTIDQAHPRHPACGAGPPRRPGAIEVRLNIRLNISFRDANPNDLST